MITVILVILGALPFVFGGFQNWYMTIHVDSLLPYTVIGLIVLLIWATLAFLFRNDGTQTKRIVICLNLIAAADLILVGIQELIFHAYWMNPIGAWSQFFYLPILNFGFTLTAWSSRVFSAYAASFLLMVGASILGCKLRERSMNKQMEAETVMKVINALFFLSVAIRNSRFGFLAYLLWGAYLLWCVRRSPAGVFRWVYIFLLAFVVVMLAGNVLALLGVIG